MWRGMLDGVLEVLAPRRCAGCDLELELEEEGFCGGCAILLDDVEAAWRPPARTASIYVYGGPMADAIRRMKYGRRTELAAVLGRLLAAGATPFVGLVDVVIPVPLHGRRLRERGFNQAALLAAPVARAFALPLDVRRLRRVRDTSAQAGLDAEGRAVNVRGAFEASGDERRPRALLVDDVRTTGATFAACAQALRAAGARDVYTLSLARADD